MKNPSTLLRDLIALPSINPAFLPEREAFTGEHRVAGYLHGIARRAGLDAEFQNVRPGRDNLLVRLTPKGTISRRILLAPHMDTVSGDLESGRLFRPRKEGDRLHGRGACDTKGSVAAMLSAILNLAARKQRPEHTEIVFAALVDEENGQLGSRALAAGGMEAGLAIVGEPTQLRVVTAHKGCVWLRLTTTGRAAHGSTPQLGANAIHPMTRIVNLLETRYRTRLNRRIHPLVGHPTINVGTIHGGRQANIVPDECSIVIDRRSIPGETTTSVRHEIKALLQRHKLRAEIADTKTDDCLPLETDVSLPLVRDFMRAARQRKALGVDYYCDASPLSRGGIPSVVFGPGNIAQAHTADEWISLKSLEGATRLLTSFLESQP